jgi:hypothetical protein
LTLILPFALAARIDSISDVGGRAERHLGDREQVFAARLDPGADLHLAAALAVVVLGEVGDAAGRKIGDRCEMFSLQVIDRRAAEVVEVVRQDLRGEADRDALGALEPARAGTSPAGSPAPSRGRRS